MNDGAERIKQIVESDMSGGLKTTLAVAQSDVAAVLNEFMDVNKLDMSVERTDNGFKLMIEADVAKIFEVGKTSICE